MRLRRLGAVFVVCAAVALTVTADKTMADPTFEGSCHGFIVSGFVDQFGGLGQAYREFGLSPRQIGEDQHVVRENCRAGIPPG